jgi:type I restriction enzyme M protein
MLASLKPTGRMGIVLDNGVLFRGGAEGRIREKVVDRDLVECVIVLPEKLFYNTGAPGCILILNKDRQAERKEKVLFVYASNGFEKLRNMNQLRDEDIDKIAAVYKEFRDIDNYAKVVPLESIKANDYNLSVTRYVDVFGKDEQVDVPVVLDELRIAERDRATVEQKLNRYLEELGYGD